LQVDRVSRKGGHSGESTQVGRRVWFSPFVIFFAQDKLKIGKERLSVEDGQYRSFSAIGNNSLMGSSVFEIGESF